MPKIWKNKMNKKLTSTDKYSFFTSFFSKKYQIQGGGLLADLQVFILISLIITQSKPLNQVKNNKLKQDEIFPPPFLGKLSSYVWN